MNVFIGGSRAVSKLNAALRARLDDLMRRGDKILVGDANGADRAVQKYLAERSYGNVLVFCVGRCRNNVGGWATRQVSPPGERRDFSYYSAKDLVMADEAKCGVMFWDAKSKGTLQNMLNLVAAGKRTLVYVAPKKEFYVIANASDLETLLAACNPSDIEAAARGLGLNTSQSHLPLSLLRS